MVNLTYIMVLSVKWILQDQWKTLKMKTVLYGYVCTSIHLCVCYLNPFCKIKNENTLNLSAVNLQYSVYWQQEKAASPLCVSYTSFSIPHLFPLEREIFWHQHLFVSVQNGYHLPLEPRGALCVFLPGIPHGSLDTVPGWSAKRQGGRGGVVLEPCEAFSDSHPC